MAPDTGDSGASEGGGPDRDAQELVARAHGWPPEEWAQAPADDPARASAEDPVRASGDVAASRGDEDLAPPSDHPGGLPADQPPTALPEDWPPASAASPWPPATAPNDASTPRRSEPWGSSSGEPWTPAPGEPWTSAPGERWTAPPAAVERAPLTPPPPRRDTGPSTFRTAFLAALLSSLLTAGLGLALLRVVPAATVSTPSSSPAASSGASPGASAVASPLASPEASASAANPSAAASGSFVAGTPEASAAPGGSPPTSTVALLVAKALPSVVTITTQTDVGFGRFGPATGVGTGIVFDSRGWILTNGHVVDGASSISVQLPDGRQLAGRVYGSASTTDIAIVKVDATGLPALGLDASKGLAVGDDVIAVGTPLGDYPGSVTTGIVSGLGRSITIRGLGTLEGLIQTDAAVNPGNSGGPLLDAAGRVVGITTATSSSAQGISFAIPIDVARPFMADALAGRPIG